MEITELNSIPFTGFPMKQPTGRARCQFAKALRREN